VFFPDPDESVSEEAATNGEAVLRIQAAIIPREDDSADADHMVVTIGQADRPGVYRVKRFTQEGEPHETWIALNVSTDESRLTLADPKMIEQLPGLEHVAVHAGGIADALSAADSGRELRWVLLGLLILVLLAEQQLSLRMSCHPETAR